MTPPILGPTWPRVRSTLGSDCLPALSQGTASLRLAYGLTSYCLHCYRAHPMSRDWVLRHGRDALPTWDSIAYWERGTKGPGSGF